MEIDSLETEVAIAGDGAASITIHNLCRALEAARDKLPAYSPEYAVADFQVRMAHARFRSLSLETPYHTRDRVGTVELRPVGENAKREQDGGS